MGPSPYLWFLHAKQRLLEQNYKSLWVPDLTCRFVRAKQRDETQALQVPALICFFYMQNSVFWSRITSLYGSQTSPVVLYDKSIRVPALISCLVHANSDFRTRLTCLYGSQTSSVVLSTHNSVLSTRIKRQYGFQPSPVVLCMQTATLALELLVSIVPCPHLRFLHANQRILDQNNKSLWVQDLTCRFVHA